MSKTAIYPGTFDPITFGHIDVIKKALKLFDKIVVAVSNVDNKDYLFDANERIEIVKKALFSDLKLNKKKILVISFSSLTTELCKKYKSNIILRGLRAASDFEYEFQLAGMNRKLNKNIETVFLMSDVENQIISSRFVKEIVKLLSAIYTDYVKSDSSLFEINPVLKTSDSKILAVDAKVSLDENALFRHKDYAQLRDLREENPIEVEAKAAGLNYVDLDGNVGCMVNGAGLAMGTMDLIKQAGGDPANFLDVGGTADAQRVETAFGIILKDPNVKAILVNIFGGIVRCDRVAQGVVDAYKNMGDKINVPIICRLQGTNAKEAKELIDNSGMEIISATEFQEAADKVQEVLTA